MRDLIAFLNCKKRTARLISDQDPISPSVPLFKQLGWMSIEQRIKYHKYLLVSKCLKNGEPVYLKNKIQYLSDRNPYSLRNVVRDRPFNLKGVGGLWFFVSFRNLFSNNTRVRIFFFPEFNIRLYDKNSESDYFFFPPPKSEYFFQQHWESEYFFRKIT